MTVEQVYCLALLMIVVVGTIIGGKVAVVDVDVEVHEETEVCVCLFLGGNVVEQTLTKTWLESSED
jgi:hypothetical protein